MRRAERPNRPMSRHPASARRTAGVGWLGVFQFEVGDRRFTGQRGHALARRAAMCHASEWRRSFGLISAACRESAEIRAELVSRAAGQAAGALYISCAGRGGPHFGALRVELQTVRNALGDLPLAGFFVGGEIARDHLYGYTGC